MLVPEKYEWKIPAQLLFASDCRQTDLQAFPAMYSFAKLFKKGVNVVHLFSAYKTASEKERIKSNFHNYSYSMQRTFSNYTLKFKLGETESINEALIKLDNQLPHIILVMVRGAKSFFDKYLATSYTQVMAYLSSKPLLIIPEGFHVKLKEEEAAITKNAGELNLIIKKIKHTIKN